VVGATAARDTIAPVDSVPVSHWLYGFSLRHELRRTARIIHTIDFLVMRSRRLGSVGVVVFVAGRAEGAGRAVEVAVRGVGRANWHRGRAYGGSCRGLIRVASGPSVGALGACPRARRSGGWRVVRGRGRRRVVRGYNAFSARPR
jgi:hypothetical protein